MTCRTCHPSIEDLLTAIEAYSTDIEEADHDFV